MEVYPPQSLRVPGSLRGPRTANQYPMSQSDIVRWRAELQEFCRDMGQELERLLDATSAQPVSIGATRDINYAN